LAVSSVPRNEKRHLKMVNFKIAAIALLLMTSGASAQQYYPQQPYGFGYQGFGYQGYGPVMVVPQQYPQEFDKDYGFYARMHGFDDNKNCWGSNC
jgi:hypothetical protein